MNGSFLLESSVPNSVFRVRRLILMIKLLLLNEPETAAFHSRAKVAFLRVLIRVERLILDIFVSGLQSTESLIAQVLLWFTLLLQSDFLIQLKLLLKEFLFSRNRFRPFSGPIRILQSFVSESQVKKKDLRFELANQPSFLKILLKVLQSLELKQS